MRKMFFKRCNKITVNSTVNGEWFLSAYSAVDCNVEIMYADITMYGVDGGLWYCPWGELSWPGCFYSSWEGGVGVGVDVKAG